MKNKKQLKKIPKYSEGVLTNPNFYSATTGFLTDQFNNIEQSKQGVTGAGVAKGALTGAASGAAVGSMIVPGIGTAIGAIGGALVGGITSSIGKSHGYDKNSRSTRFSDIYQEGSGLAALFGRSKGWAKRKTNQTQSSNVAEMATNYLSSEYKNNPNVEAQPNILAAEGGIMRRPVDALVSKGELIYDPIKKTLIKVPGNNGKVNTDDDVLPLVVNFLLLLLFGTTICPSSNTV